jgi:hypothetical protein
MVFSFARPLTIVRRLGHHIGMLGMMLQIKFLQLRGKARMKKVIRTSLPSTRDQEKREAVGITELKLSPYLVRSHPVLTMTRTMTRVHLLKMWILKRTRLRWVKVGGGSLKLI